MIDYISKIAYLQLKKTFESHKFHIEVPINGKLYRKWANNALEHPIPSIDQGWYKVNCTTNLSAYEPKQIANMVVQVNDKATNAFMQQIRRRINIITQIRKVDSDD